MIPEKRVLVKRTLPLLLVGLLIFICYLYFLVGIYEMVTIIKSTNLFYYSLAVVALLLNMVFSSLAWQYFLRPLSINVPFRKTFLFALIGSFIDILIPAESVSGDVSKAYLMSKDSGENTGRVVASIVSHRILSIIITLSSLIIASASLFIFQYKFPSFVFNLILFIVIGTAISLVFMFLLCLREQPAQKIIDLILRFLAFILRGRLQLASLRSEAQKALSAFHQSMGALSRNPRSFVQPAFFSIVAWLLGVLLSFLVFVSLGYIVSVGALIIVYAIICSVQTIPIGILADVGPMEIIMTSLYIALLGPQLGPQAAPIGAAATVLIRIITVWFKFFMGLVAFQWVGIKTLSGGSR